MTTFKGGCKNSVNEETSSKYLKHFNCFDISLHVMAYKHMRSWISFPTIEMYLASIVTLLCPKSCVLLQLYSYWYFKWYFSYFFHQTEAAAAGPAILFYPLYAFNQARTRHGIGFTSNGTWHWLNISLGNQSKGGFRRLNHRSLLFFFF